MSPIYYPTSIVKRDGSLTSFDQSAASRYFSANR